MIHKCFKTLRKEPYDIMIYVLLRGHFSGDGFKTVICMNEISKDWQHSNVT